MSKVSEAAERLRAAKAAYEDAAKVRDDFDAKFIEAQNLCHLLGGEWQQAKQDLCNAAQEES